jgi:uncharacterized membrane protein (DUF4010 family)
VSIDLFGQMALAVALGLLVGLQRERQHTRLAGIRTFPLIALFGVLCGYLANARGGAIVVAGVLGLAALIVVANVARLRDDDADPGMTTEIAVLVMFGVGVLLATGRVLEGIVGGAGVALLLHWKDPLHGFARRIGPRDFAALMRLVLVALVVLPVLPDRSYGPYDVLNPFRIWLVVVLILGISLAGYVAFKLLGTRRGALVAGVLGGVISSTATTVGYARRSREQAVRPEVAAFVVVIASAVVFLRVLLEIAVVAPEVLNVVALPLLAMTLLLGALGAGLARTGPAELDVESPEQEPPIELRSALAFGALYAVVLVGVAFARQHLGEAGLFAVAVASGLTDVDAITLSTAQMMKLGSVAPSTGWRMILVGALSNLVFKAVVVAVFASPELRNRVIAVFAVAVLAGAAIVAFWPA